MLSACERLLQEALNLNWKKDIRVLALANFEIVSVIEKDQRILRGFDFASKNLKGIENSKLINEFIKVSERR